MIKYDSHEIETHIATTCKGGTILCVEFKEVGVQGNMATEFPPFPSKKCKQNANN